MGEVAYLRSDEVLLNDLQHFGVKGMHWGVWNDETRRRRLGVTERESSPNISVEPHKSRGSLTDSQKKTLKTAVGVGAGLAVLGVGVYAINKGYLTAGKDVVNETLGKMGQKTSSVIAKTKNGTLVHSVKESHIDTIRKSNPSKCQHNCPVTSTVGVLREHFGIDCEARYFDSPPEGLDFVRECFSNAKTIPRGVGDAARATEFGKSPEAAQNLLRKRFGDNASGMVGFEWVPRYPNDQQKGHFITFKIEDGVVSFFDCQDEKVGDIMDTAKYWKRINSNGMLQAARLDDAIPNYDALEKYVKFK